MASSRPHPALLQQRRDVSASCGRPRRCPTSTATATPTRCSSSTRVAGRFETVFGPIATAPAITSSSPSARRGASIPDAGAAQRCSGSSRPSEIEPPQALPQRLRAAPGALARTTSATSAPPTRRRRTPRRGDFVIHVTRPRPRHPLPLPPSPARRRRLGRLPVPVHLQHRRLRADHRARPPAAAGPPDLPASQLRRLLVRAAQVRLPPARHPGARTTTATSTAMRSSTTWPATS